MNVRTPYQPFPTSPSGLPPPLPPPAEPTPRERIARLKTLSRRALVYWKASFLILLIGCGVALAAAMKVVLIYHSECTVLFKPGIRTGDRDEDNPNDRGQRMGSKLKDVLMTRTRLEALIKQYSLYPKIVDSRGIVDAVEEMQTHIGFRARDSETFVISFENEKQEIAQQVTASLADSMINEFSRASLSNVKQGAEFLTKQEQRSAAELENANKALATFLTQHPEFALETKTTAFGSGAGTPMQPQLPVLPMAKGETPQSSSDPQLAVLYRQKARLEAEIRSSGGGPGPAAQPLGAGDTVAKLTLARDEAAKAAAAAAADLADKRTRLTDEHPDVISAKMTASGAARTLRQAEVQLAAAQAAQAAQNGQASNPYDAPAGDANVQRRISQLNADIAARQDAIRRTNAQASDGGTVAPVGETNELVELETQWQTMLSALHDTRAEHDDLKARLERAKLSANVAEAAGGDQMLVIDAAYLPMRPSKGGRTKTALAGGVVALLLAMAYAFARVFMNDTLIDSADVEALHVIPVLGVLPKVRPTPAGPAAGDKELRRVV